MLVSHSKSMRTLPEQLESQEKKEKRKKKKKKGCLMLFQKHTETLEKLDPGKEQAL